MMNRKILATLCTAAAVAIIPTGTAGAAPLAQGAPIATQPPQASIACSSGVRPGTGDPADTVSVYLFPDRPNHLTSYEGWVEWQYSVSCGTQWLRFHLNQLRVNVTVQFYPEAHPSSRTTVLSGSVRDGTTTSALDASNRRLCATIYYEVPLGGNTIGIGDWGVRNPDVQHARRITSYCA